MYCEMDAFGLAMTVTAIAVMAFTFLWMHGLVTGGAWLIQLAMFFLNIAAAVLLLGTVVGIVYGCLCVAL